MERSRTFETELGNRTNITKQNTKTTAYNSRRRYATYQRPRDKMSLQFRYPFTVVSILKGTASTWQQGAVSYYLQPQHYIGFQMPCTPAAICHNCCIELSPVGSIFVG